MGLLKKSLFYSLDATIAMFLIAGAIIVFATLSSSEIPTQHLTTTADDFVNVLSAIKVKDARYNVIISIENLTERQLESTLLEYLGELWAENNLALARDILGNLSLNILPGDVVTDVSFGTQKIFSSEQGKQSMGRSISSRIVTGVAENETVRGVSARTYLTGINNKLTSAFLYFGGFVGQGNITKRGAYLPSDAEVVNITLELYIGSDASLYINDIHCENIVFADTGLNSTMYDLSSCIHSLQKGAYNDFSFIFNGSDADAFVGGGFIDVQYRTRTPLESALNETTYFFPGIEGIINLYSSFYVPGDMQSLEIMLHYNLNHSSMNNATLFLKLADTLIFSDNTGENETSIILDDALLSSMLNYSDMGSTTIPLRLGFENLSYVMEMDGGDADIVLITDLSGSMNRCVDSNNACTTGCAGSSCRIDLAKQIAKNFVDAVLNLTGNRIGLVTYSTDADAPLQLTSNETLLNSTINGFSVGGATCISCAVRESRIMLQEQSNSSRQKYIIIMTDGIGNIETNDVDVNDTDGCTYFWCGGRSWCGCPDYKSDCGGCLSYDAICSDYVSDNARDDAVNDSCYAENKTGATLYSVGFGAGSISCNYAMTFLEDMAVCGGGKNFSSDDANELNSIYSSIADQIIVSSRSSQIVEIGGGDINAELFSDSYITSMYNPPLSFQESGTIDIVFSSDRFDTCLPSIEMPDAAFKDALVTSYSSKYWTDFVSINGNSVFNLSHYSNNYSSLGDPFIINIPVEHINSGLNNMVVNVGDSPSNSSGCSPHSRIVYTIMIPMSIPQTDIHNVAEGCTWQIEYDYGGLGVLSVPSYYSGLNSCEFSSVLTDYNADDAIDNAVFELLTNLDVDGDNRVDVRIDSNGFNIETHQVYGIPGLWGPTKFTVSVGK